MMRAFLTPAVLTLSAVLAIVVAASPSLETVPEGATPPREDGTPDRVIIKMDPPTVVDFTNDPFRAFDEKPVPVTETARPLQPGAPLVLEGTILGPRGWVAHISGKWYRTGERIGNDEVLEIEVNRARLKGRDGKTWDLRSSPIRREDIAPGGPLGAAMQGTPEAQETQ